MSESTPTPVTIARIIEETPSIRTFEFSHNFSFRPGQFVMVWIPGIDEIPMALSSTHSISVQRVGDATAALFAMKEGDMLGIRGPFGNGFAVEGQTLAIAGGIGAAPLRPLVGGGKVDCFILGARSYGELPFLEELGRETTLVCATDDGTYGHHGFVTDLMDGIDLRAYEHICVCGPEVMMRTVLEKIEGAGIAQRGQFSLHRYMKCGVGLCGSCCIDPSGLRVCRDGPIFTGDQLKGSEFGRYTRDASGRKVFL